MGVMRWIRVSDCESKRCVVSCRVFPSLSFPPSLSPLSLPPPSFSPFWLKPLWLKAIQARTELYSSVRLWVPKVCLLWICPLQPFSLLIQSSCCWFLDSGRGRSLVKITSSDPISVSTPVLPRTIPDVDTVTDSEYVVLALNSIDIHAVISFEEKRRYSDV